MTLARTTSTTSCGTILVQQVQRVHRDRKVKREPQAHKGLRERPERQVRLVLKGSKGRQVLLEQPEQPARKDRRVKPDQQARMVQPAHRGRRVSKDRRGTVSLRARPDRSE